MARLSRKEAEALGLIPKKHKFNAKRTTVDGIDFPSQHEAQVYLDYKALQRAGKITNLTRQKRYPIVVNGVKIASWFSDFEYDDVDTMKHHVVDAKGFKTPVYKLKKKLVEALYRITIEEVSNGRVRKRASRG